MTEARKDNHAEKHFDFRAWIRKQTNRGYTLTEQNPDSFRLETPYGHTDIRFYDNIAELSVIRNKDDELRYYLHFEVLDEEHAVGLYREMEEALLSLEKEKTLHVVLSCTSGATTGFLAEKLNQAADLMGLDYRFDGVSYYLLYDKAEEADIILLAPQIRYLQKKIEIAWPTKTILPIPTKLFTSNNTGGILDFVEETIRKKQEDRLDGEEREDRQARLDRDPSLEDYIVLQIMILFDYGQLKVRMRLRDHGELVLEETSLHKRLTNSGIRGEIEYCLAGVDHCDLISIAMPGEVSDGRIIRATAAMNFSNERLAESIEHIFHTHCYLVNSVNAAVYGYAIEHPEYRNVSMLSQPFGTPGSGQGNVVNGQLVVGKEGIAGESDYFISRMQFSGPLRKLAKTEQGQMEIVLANILPTISLFGPDVFLLRTPMVSNMDEVHSRLRMFLPERVIPELLFISDMSELVFTGLRRLSEAFLRSVQEKSIRVLNEYQIH